MAFIGPNIFCCPSIFTSFSARDWTSLSESFYFTLDSLTCAMHKCRCVRRRGPSSFQFGLDTIRWRWRYAIRRRWGDDTSRSGGTFDGRARTGWLVERRGEEREAGAGPRHCSSTFSWRRGPAASESESARSDFFVYTLLVLPLPLLVAAAQLTRMQQRSTDAIAPRAARPLPHPYDEQGERALWDESSNPRDCPARCDYEARLPGPTLLRRTTAMDIPIPTTSASATRRKKAVTKVEDGASGLSSTAILCAARTHHGAYEDRRRATSGEHYGTSLCTPATGPPATTTRWEIERDGEVYSRSRSHPAPYDDCSRPASYDRILMTGIEIGIGIAYRPTDGADDGYGREEMARRSGSGARASDGGPSTT
ncbi:hypothetical protein B0H13DRAFT_2669367 [Mycena leptocephala]|nr:hypothetical protein B0H13DRAFT_2669367 [Mycena leptocephala]